MTYIILLVLIGLSEKNETGSWIISPMLILVKSFPHNWNGKLQVTTPGSTELQKWWVWKYPPKKYGTPSSSAFKLREYK